MKNLPIKKFFKKLGSGILFGIGVTLGIGVISLVYATWTSLPTQTSGSPLTSTIWNDLVNGVNDIGKRTDNIYSTGGNIGIGTNNPGGIFEIASVGAGKTIINDKDGGLGGDSSLIFSNNGSEKYFIRNRDGVDFEISRSGTSQDFYLKNGNVGIGTASPSTKLEVVGSLKVGGSETGVAANDIKSYIQKVVCENRRGVWVDGTGCDEYAYFTAACTYTTCSCNTGYHMCTFPDLFTGGFNSLRRPGYNNSAAYSWIAGNYIGSAAGQSSMFYQGWSYNSEYIICSANTHVMVDMRRGANGNTAWGCYPDSYTNSSAMCCKNNQ